MSEIVDTVIVGGGIGGTALGALLASGGQKVVLLEKNSIIGGRCASYEKEGFVVDVGVHLFGLGDKGPLGEVCRLSGEPDAIKWVLARNPRVSMHFRGETRAFSRESIMGDIDPKEWNNLGRLFGQVMQMTEDDLDTLWYTSVHDWLSRFSHHRDIHRLFGMLCGIYLCITPRESSAAEFIKAFRDVGTSRSSGYPKGGCVEISRTYQRIIEKHGGEVRLSSPAEEIVIEKGAATGVLSKGDYIKARQIVSNADIKATIGGLARPEHFPPDYVERVQSLTFAAHVVALKVALDEKITDQKMIMYAPDVDDEKLEEIENAYLEGGRVPMIAGGMINSPTNFDPGLAPPGKQLVFFGTRCERNQDWRKWGRICMDALSRVFPGIEEHVLWTAVDSPDDVEQYAGEDGNVIGVGQTVNQIHERRPKQETPVKNLYLCSAETSGHGIGTEFAASSALRLSKKLL